MNDEFVANTRNQLLKVIDDTPIISVSQKPINLGQNICVGDIGYESINIYKQALIGAKEAKTRYIAMAEDDVLYSPDHFIHIPKDKSFSYNLNVGTIYTWNKEACFIFKHRQVLHSLICEREYFIDAMEERFSKFPDAVIKPDCWTEPGKGAYEKKLGVTVRWSERFMSEIANIVFCSPQHLGFRFQGFRRKLGVDRKKELPYWGKVEDIIKLYKNP